MKASGVVSILLRIAACSELPEEKEERQRRIKPQARIAGSHLAFYRKAGQRNVGGSLFVHAYDLA
jgi:hypothetical protein